MDETKTTVFGKVIQSDGKETPLYFRDLTNKIIHGAEFQWDFRRPLSPKIICLSDEPERWQRAEVEVTALMSLVGTEFL
jgi:hypothetical protein